MITTAHSSLGFIRFDSSTGEVANIVSDPGTYLHRISRVDVDEAVEFFGRLPHNGDILIYRLILKDGSILEPDNGVRDDLRHVIWGGV